MQDRPSYYITTPIYYVNAAPHLGTAYSTVLADVQARFRRRTGYDVMFLTGLDEHGEKVAQAAEEHGMTPQAWCDSLTGAFTDLWRYLNITNDDFIRTTEDRQTASVQHLWNVLKENGSIYKGVYDGWYCQPEETYFTDTQVRHANLEMNKKMVDVAHEEVVEEVKHHHGDAPLCPDCGRPLKRVQEESWFFKLSEFQEPLLKLYREHPHFVEPEIRRNEVVSFVEGGLKDLSISRTSFDWGIPLPFDEKHVTYVWFDALINYITAVGYGVDDALFERRWPAQVHIVGKDIIRFHCVIWPAMLMAAGLEVPEEVFAHGFLMVRSDEGADVKMSKSLGNAISPESVCELLGVDGYRYYFMTDVRPGTDGSISWGRMEQVYDADLANSWGNLVSRAISMSAKYFDGATPPLAIGWAEDDNELKAIVSGLEGEGAAHTREDGSPMGLVERYGLLMGSFAYDEAAGAVMELIHAANHFIEVSEPWALAKDPARAGELAQVIGSVLEAIRISAHLLEPFMPETSAEVLRRLSAEDELDTTDLAGVCAWGGLQPNAPVVKGAALFPRLAQAKG